MKRFLAIVAALCAMVAIYAVAAPAGQQSVSPTKLEKQIKSLTKKVKSLRRSVVQIQGVIACFQGVLPVHQYVDYVGGDPANPSGFYNTTALDVPQDQAVGRAFLLVINSKCTTSSSTQHFKSLRAPAAHH